MNHSEVKNMIKLINHEMQSNEDLISNLITKNEQLEIARQNLEHYSNGDWTTVTASPKLPEVALDPIPAAVDVKPKRKPMSMEGGKKIAEAQRARWAKFNKLAKTPLKKTAKILHWTKRPENAQRVKALAKKMQKARLAS